MAPGRHEHREIEQHVAAEIVFNPRAFGAEIPKGSQVYLMSNLSNPPWQMDSNFQMHQVGGDWRFSGECPAGDLEYKVFVVPPAGEAFWIPPGRSETNIKIAISNGELPTIPLAEEPRKGGASGEVIDIDDARRQRGEVVPEMPENDVLMKTAADVRRAVNAVGEEADEEDEAADLTNMQERIADSMKQLFELAQGEGFDKDTAKAIAGVRNEHQKLLREYARYGGSEARDFLLKTHRRMIEERRAEWVRGREDLSLPNRELLASPGGKLKFRITTFNRLCERGKFGLKLQNRFRGIANDEKAFLHFRRHLKDNYPLFNRICGSFDGGSVAHALEAVSMNIVDKALPKDRLEGFDRRAKAKAALEKKVRKRFRLEGDAFASPAEAKWYTKALGEGGDIALKIAAIVTLTSNPALAAGMYGLRSAMQFATASEFGSVLTQTMKLPFKLAAKPAKLLRYLPQNLKDKLPDRFQDWLERPSSKLFGPMGRAKMSLKERGKLAARGLIPAPWLLGRIPKVEKIVAEPEAMPGEAYEAQTSEAEEAISEACSTALASLSKKTSQKESPARLKLVA